jgi:hypothetical protein
VAALVGLPPLAAQPVVFSGRVLTGAEEHPVAEAIVEVPSLRLRTRTDSLGRFRMRAVPGGAHTVAVRAIGFDPWLGLLQFAAGDSLEVDVLLGSAITRLATLRVTASRGDARTAWVLREFEDRRRTGLGKFLTEEYFAAAVGASVCHLIAHRLAARCVRTENGDALQVTRRGVPCFPGLAINGLPRDRTDLSLLQALEVLGAEFHSAATVPAQYNATQAGSCGAVIVWTR